FKRRKIHESKERSFSICVHLHHLQFAGKNELLLKAMSDSKEEKSITQKKDHFQSACIYITSNLGEKLIGS
ncbi:MAG: hypothetical protein ABIT58_05060, partial [Ferruginibacter sp.]